MKTVKTANGSIIRMSDEQARRTVDNTNYYYCSKDEYKLAVKNGEEHVKWHKTLE